MKQRMGSIGTNADPTHPSKGNRLVIQFFAHPRRPQAVWLVRLIGAFVLAVVLGACKSNTGPTTDQPLDPPTNPRAFAKDDSSVVLSWTRTRSDNLSVFGKYRVTAVDDTGAVGATELTPTKADTSITITGLREGETYTFNIVATVVASATGYTDSPPAVIAWAPARRFVADTSGPIRLYETIGYPDSSGLIVFDSTLGGPRRVSLVNPGRDSLFLDFVVTSLGAPVYVSSADYYNAGWRQSRFSSVIDYASSLHYARTAPPEASTYTERFIEVPNTLISTSAILYFRTANGNYGRMLLERDPSKGVLIWGPYQFRYLTLQISYQTTPDVPYSERVRQEEQMR